ncbi:urease accessory protein UreF [Litoreibacter janthinus]|uniref:Urease accessory protein UreF n=1 Tax=Litoreibacter janthinus TaxID=670154 RepID=A0A1I6FWI4_9RHOB|nr:urease accessory UreF family protein [Litoreibacter janthinus]SFR34268.1 urease accessory protein [Litoreibacter janthinus]
MTTSAKILTLTQWFSPSYPIGAFAYSHGLETAIHSGEVACASSLKAWLSDVLEHGSGRTDCILLRASYSCETNDELQIVDDTARAFAASKERVQEAFLMGQAFGKTTAAIWGGDVPDQTNAVAVGAAARREGLPVDLTAAMYLQSFTSNLVSAAVRLVPLGQTEGQSVLAELTPLCDALAASTESATLDDLHSTAFLSDIASMRHETLQPRIFRT